MKTTSLKWAALLFAGALASCNNNDEPVVADEGLMLVSLGANTNTVTTKAAINGTEIPAGLEFSVWGLAKNAENSWANYATAGDRTSLFAGGGVTATVADGKFVFPMDTYYPSENRMNYTFYGVSPVPAAAPTIEDDDVMTVSYTVDGTQDVLWGCAFADDSNKEFKGYNAKYLRQSGNEDDQPSIEFNHMLVRFSFQIVLADNGGNLNPTGLRLNNITLKDVKNMFSFQMANRAVTAYDAVPAVTLADGTVDLPLINDEGTVITTTAFTTTEPLPVGDMMIPTDGSITEVKMSAEFLNEKDELFPYTGEIRVKADAAEGQAFLSGKRYMVTMTVNPERLVEVYATLMDWEDGAEIEDMPEIN